MVKIITDSTVYMKKAEAEALGIKIAGISYSVGGREYIESYIDECGNFIALLDGGEKKQTAQAGIHSFAEAYSEIIAGGDDALCITLSSHLSGTYQSAVVAAEDIPKGRVAVVDSLTTAGGLRALVLKARELAEGGMSLAALAKTISEMRKRVAIILTVEDLTPLREGGRLGAVGHTVGQLLNIQPLLLCDNKPLVPAGIARGRAEQIKKLAARPPKDAVALFVHYAAAKDDAHTLMGELRKAGFACPMELLPIGPVLTVHLGTGILGVGWIRKE